MDVVGLMHFAWPSTTTGVLALSEPISIRPMKSTPPSPEERESQPSLYRAPDSPRTSAAKEFECMLATVIKLIQRCESCGLCRSRFGLLILRAANCARQHPSTDARNGHSALAHPTNPRFRSITQSI